LELEKIPLEFISLAGNNSFIRHVSSPRSVMDSNHISSRVSLLHPNSKLIQSGIEYELAKYINDVKIEYDCIVKAIIPRYGNFGEENISSISLIVEYEENNNIYLDLIEIPSYNSTHNLYGYKLKYTDELKNSTYNSFILKDTILAKTDSLGKNKDYKYGLNANVVFMSNIGVAEDGYIISESFAKRATYTILQKRVIYINKNTIPLNTFGNNEIYKIFPNIGEYTKENGLLLALRTKNDWFNLIDMSDENLQEVDYVFDNLTYCHPKSKVIDIKVYKPFNKPEFSSNITNQLDLYANLYNQYLETVINRYKSIIKEKKSIYGNVNNIHLTPRLHRFIVDNTIFLNSINNNKTKICYRKIPIDLYRLEIITMVELPLQVGNKIADISAAKGVICKILPDDQMPIDKYGRKADIITDSASTISRMNLSRSYEHYLGSVSLDCKYHIKSYLYNKYKDNLNNILDEDLIYCYNYLKGLYNLINPLMVEFIDSLNKEELYNHIYEIVTDNLYLYWPIDNEYNIIDVIKNIENSIYKPLYDKLTFKDSFGNTIETEIPIRIGTLYYMVLDKTSIGQNTATSSSRTNAFGFPIKASGSEKNRLPQVANQSPIKNLSETEVRIITSLADPEFIAELMDTTLNKVTHQNVIKQILESKEAFPIINIDRNIVPYNPKSLAILKHICQSAGFTFEYEPEIK